MHRQDFHFSASDQRRGQTRGRLFPCDQYIRVLVGLVVEPETSCTTTTPVKGASIPPIDDAARRPAEHAYGDPSCAHMLSAARADHCHRGAPEHGLTGSGLSYIAASSLRHMPTDLLSRFQGRG